MLSYGNSPVIINIYKVTEADFFSPSFIFLSTPLISTVAISPNLYFPLHPILDAKLRIFKQNPVLYFTLNTSYGPTLHYFDLQWHNAMWYQCVHGQAIAALVLSACLCQWPLLQEYGEIYGDEP